MVCSCSIQPGRSRRNGRHPPQSPRRAAPRTAVPMPLPAVDRRLAGRGWGLLAGSRSGAALAASPPQRATALALEPLGQLPRRGGRRRHAAHDGCTRTHALAGDDAAAAASPRLRAGEADACRGRGFRPGALFRRIRRMSVARRSCRSRRLPGGQRRRQTACCWPVSATAWFATAPPVPSSSASPWKRPCPLAALSYAGDCLLTADHPNQLSLRDRKGEFRDQVKSRCPSRRGRAGSRWRFLRRRTG